MKACNEVISLLLNTSPVYFLHFRKKNLSAFNGKFFLHSGAVGSLTKLLAIICLFSVKKWNHKKSASPPVYLRQTPSVWELCAEQAKQC